MSIYLVGLGQSFELSDVVLVVCGRSVVSDSLRPHVSLFSTVAPSLLKFMFFEMVLLSDSLILCLPLLLPSIFPSIRVFSNESALRIRWLKYWRFSINSSNEHQG